MTTVYILTWAVDYEGETLLGVYDSQEAATAAGQVWLGDRTLRDCDDLCIRPVVVGAPAEYSLYNIS